MTIINSINFDNLLVPRESQPVDPHAPGRSSERRRPIFDPEAGEFIEVAIHDRRELSPSAFIAGPAVIVEDETSTVVTRRFGARIDAFGYIQLTRRPDQ